MLHLFDMMYNNSIILNILGRTNMGMKARDYYMEYRAFMWMHNKGKIFNVSNSLRAYGYKPDIIKRVQNNLLRLNQAVVNP